MWRAEVPLKKDWATGLLLLLAVISFMWLRSIDNAQKCCAEYYPYYGETVSYSKILDEYQGGIFDKPLSVFILFNAITVILAFFARRPWLVILLILPVECFSCSVMAGFNAGTTLREVDEATFAGKSFYLTQASTGTDNMDTTLESLILFECAFGKEDCHARQLMDYRALYYKVSLQVEDDQLRIYAGDDIIFALEPSDY